MDKWRSGLSPWIKSAALVYVPLAVLTIVGAIAHHYGGADAAVVAVFLVAMSGGVVVFVRYIIFDK